MTGAERRSRPEKAPETHQTNAWTLPLLPLVVGHRHRAMARGLVARAVGHGEVDSVGTAAATAGPRRLQHDAAGDLQAHAGPFAGGDSGDAGGLTEVERAVAWVGRVGTVGEVDGDVAPVGRPQRYGPGGHGRR